MNRSFNPSLAYLLAQLERVDLLLQAQLHLQPISSSDHFAHTISEEEISQLLAQPLTASTGLNDPVPEHLQRQLKQQQLAQAERINACQDQNAPLRLLELAHHFQLSPVELDILLIALAPEIDPRYEKLYGYLQNDATQGQPTVAFVFTLLFPALEDKLLARSCFSSDAPLIKHQLIGLTSSATSQSTLLSHKICQVTPRAVAYLLQDDGKDSRLEGIANCIKAEQALDELVFDESLKQALLTYCQQALNDTPASCHMIYFKGTPGMGRQRLAEALCQSLARDLLIINMEQILEQDLPVFINTLYIILREAFFQRAAIYWQAFSLCLEDKQAVKLKQLLNTLQQHSGLHFFAGETHWTPGIASGNSRFISIDIPPLDASMRLRCWQAVLDTETAWTKETDLKEIAGRFRLNPEQIRAVAATVRDLAQWQQQGESLDHQGLIYQACHLHSNPQLAKLAQKISPHYRWEDVVLPDKIKQQLNEIRLYVKHRATVYEQWGFAGKLSMGKGLNALFSGPPGTGKTMSAEVLANELGLELYKVDLSTVVSKYIGETEKNLGKIFDEAATSNAILFFDEADALFGKRSDVQSSHDRNANIEVSYLLQKMEEYEGIVFLASNYKRNIDEAFVRRLHFCIEFPFPGEAERLQIWQQIWPEHTPVSEDVDLSLLAKNVELAGGSIRNIALYAAFMAAEEATFESKGEVTMAHLVQGALREFQKTGKLVEKDEIVKQDSRLRSLV